MDWKLRKAERPGKGARAARVLRWENTVSKRFSHKREGVIPGGVSIVTFNQFKFGHAASVQGGRDCLEESRARCGAAKAGEETSNLDEMEKLHVEGWAIRVWDLGVL